MRECHHLNKSCQFSDLSGETIDNQLLRDKIVHGIDGQNIQVALQNCDLVLETATQFVQSSKQSKHQFKLLTTDLKEVTVLGKFSGKLKKNSMTKKASNRFFCGRCKKRYGPRECLAFGKVFSHCSVLSVVGLQMLSIEQE